MTRTEYNVNRQRIISGNRSRRMRRHDPLPVPPKLAAIYGFEIIDAEGTYVGFTLSPTQAEKHRANGYTSTRRIAQNTGNLPVL